MTAAEESRPKKSVTVFIGGGRKRGLTWTASRQLLDRLETYGDVRGEIVFLADYDLGLCRGCKACFARGEESCPLGGDRDVLLAKMEAADGVVFASPNYSFQVSAIMKAFLDRLGFVFHRPRFHGKAFTSIVVQGFYGGGRIERYLAFVGAGLGFNVARGSCVTGLEPMAEKDRRRMEAALAAQSRRFHALLAGPSLRAPTMFQLMGFRMGRTCVRQTLAETDRDYAYYRERGWFESAYYAPAELGPFKRAAGAIFDWIFARAYPPADARVRPAASVSRD